MDQTVFRVRRVPFLSFLQRIMRIQLACVALLFATVNSQPGATREERHQKFILQHVNANMLTNRCTAVIGRDKLTQTDSNLCKPTNTYIRATAGLIKPVCGAAGQRDPFGPLTTSTNPFDIVVCTLRNQGSRHPRCVYDGQRRTRRIQIRCEEGVPVHFGDDIFYLQNWLNSSCVLQLLK